MDIIYEIRRRYLIQKQTVAAIAKDMGLSRPTVRKHLLTVEEPQYKRVQPEAPKLRPFKEQLTQWLIDDAKLARPRRRCGHRMYEGLQAGVAPFQWTVFTSAKYCVRDFILRHFVLLCNPPFKVVG